ncbi:MMPL family transporter [Kribbella albertanoniae]|uniref:MMPL family transporter n=1 Tax=Kribbella albertanoniae TaxID=1266829 RepID=A0A4R4Q192_9ACTN|nr:MMPL family transporter [Kribbella albertanoniae]TDC28513.1 MMPL family transporter [Kribbella albertanoniae]
MAIYLYRLGRFAFRRRGLVAFLWLAVLAAGVVGSVTLSGPTATGFSIPGTESQRAADLLAQRFPQAGASQATARIAFQTGPGRQLADEPEVRQTLARIATAPQVSSVVDPFTAKTVSPDGRTGYAQVTFSVPSEEVTAEAKEAVDAAVAPARASGLTVEYGGDALEADGGPPLSEVIGLAVAALVLLLMFRSLVAAALPLLSALVGIGIAVTAISTASGFVGIGSSTPLLALMLGLAVSVDYALFIMSRYRHELSTGLDPEEATGRAVGTAGSAVVFAGATVVIALAGLFVVDIPFLTQMGVAAALTVVLAVAIALTLLPALLGFAGRRVTPNERTGSMGRNWARMVTRRPVAVLAVSVLGLGALALPATDLELEMPNDSTSAPDSTQRKTYDLVSGAFGPGVNGPLIVVVDGGTSATAAATAQTISTLPGVAAVKPPRFNPAGDTALLTVVPTTGPGSSETRELVQTLRDLPEVPGTRVSVTGSTAVDIDMSDKLASALAPYLALVVGLAFLLLTLVFRSIVVPLKATLGFLLTVAATFGALVAIFQWGWLAGLFGLEGQAAPVIPMLPVLLVGVVFGLAMDYQVFLVTRMREAHVRGAGPRAAVIDGFAHSARVVTAAAVVMVAVFAGFILAGQTLIVEMGFGLAFAVAIDAFVVRMTIVPAVLALLGNRAWYLPAWLDRLLPTVDIEGESLRRQAPQGVGVALGR